MTYPVPPPELSQMTTNDQNHEDGTLKRAATGRADCMATPPHVSQLDPWGECRHWFGLSRADVDVSWAPFLSTEAFGQAEPKLVLDPTTFVLERDQ